MKKLLLALLFPVVSMAGTVTTLVKNESGVCSQDVNFTSAMFAIGGESALTTSDWAAPGAIGSTTPAAGTFTTLQSAQSNGKLLVQNGTAPNQIRLSAFNAAGDANAAIIFEGYANEYMRIDSSGNVGLGVTPSAWQANYKVLEMGNSSAFWGYSAVPASYVTTNAVLADVYRYKVTGPATEYYQYAGGHIWETAPSGTAGNAITFTQAMTLASTGNLLLGTATDNATSKLQLGFGDKSTASAFITLLSTDAAEKTDLTIARFVSPALGHSIQSAEQGVAYRTLALNPLGGNVLVGTYSESATAARLVVKGSTADGTTNVLELQDSSGAGVFGVNSDGRMLFSGTTTFPGVLGSAAAYMYLTSANGLAMYGYGGVTDIIIANASGGTICEAPHNTSDMRFYGSILFGADSDTNLYRSAANTLKTDDVLEHKGTYGEIYVADGSTAQTIATGASYTKITPFAAESDYSDCTPSHANDQITLTRAGKYMVTINWSGAVSLANTTWDFALFKNSTEINSAHASRKFSATDVGSLTAAGIVTVAANDVLTLQVKHDNVGSVDITTHDCGFSVYYLGY